MPDLSITPAARIHDAQVSGYLAASHTRSSELASSLTAMLKSFAKQYPLTKVYTFDTYTYSQVQLQTYAAQGYNITDPCYTPVYMGLPGPVCAIPTNICSGTKIILRHGGQALSELLSLLRQPALHCRRDKQSIEKTLIFFGRASRKTRPNQSRAAT